MCRRITTFPFRFATGVLRYQHQNYEMSIRQLTGYCKQFFMLAIKTWSNLVFKYQGQPNHMIIFAEILNWSRDSFLGFLKSLHNLKKITCQLPPVNSNKNINKQIVLNKNIKKYFHFLKKHSNRVIENWKNG